MCEMLFVRILAMNKAQTGKTYNICSGNAVSLEKILQDLISLVDKKEIKIAAKTVNVREAENNVFYGSAELFKQDTSWQAKYNLRQSLEDTLTYWKKIVSLV